MDSASCTRLNLLDAQRVQKIREDEGREIEIGKKGTMPRQKCDNARSLARPVAASRSLQREIMPSWQNCIVAARRFPLFCDSLDRSACLLLSPVSYRFTCFSGWGGRRRRRTKPIMLGWKRGDNAADDRVCLLIRERRRGGTIQSDSREQFWKTGSEKVLSTGIHRGWKIRGWSWEGNQLILIERDSTSAECFEHRRWEMILARVKNDV